MWLHTIRGKKGADTESQKALQDARLNLVRAHSRTSEVRQVASALRTIREVNHFAEKLSYIVTKGQPL